MAVLGLLEKGPASDPLLVQVLGPLVAAFREGSRKAVAELRREVQTWKATTEQLRQVAGSPLLELGDEAAAVLAKLERARQGAERIVEVLAALGHSPSPLRARQGTSDSASQTYKPEAPAKETARTSRPSLARQACKDCRERHKPDAQAKDGPGAAQCETPTPAARSAAVPKRPSTDALSYCCPGCRKIGMVRWSNLQPGKVLCCPHCNKSFTSNRTGGLVEVVKDTTGRWVERGGLADTHRRARWRRGVVAVALLLSVLVSGLCWAAGLTTSPAAPVADLPQELEPRAELFARAWLQGDYGVMRKLTDPAQDRLLFAWYKRSPVPDLGAAGNDSGEVRVAVEVPAIRSSTVSLRVRFEGLRPARGGTSVNLQLSWEERGGNWFFQPGPDSRLRPGS
jgi:hypothetical protein